MARIAVIARGNAVEKDGSVYFQQLDARLLTGLCKHGHEVVCLIPLILSSNPLFQVFSIYDATIPQHNFSFVSLPGYYSSNMRFLSKLIIWARATRQMWRPIRFCDAIIVLMPSPIGLAGFMIGKLLGIAMVVYYGGDWAAHLGGTQPGRSKSAQAYIRLATWLCRLLERLVYWQSPILLVRNIEVYNLLSRRRSGVFPAAPLTGFSIKHVFQREDTCRNGRVICLTVGALVPNKGISDILRGVRILLDAGFLIQWWHAGGSYPEYRTEIDKLVNELDLSNHVRLLGYMKQEELVSIYRQSDIFILASRSEGMPRVLAEAMSQGLPVIATRVGGAGGALEHEQHALLIEPKNPKSIAEAVMRLINDGPLRRKLIQCGRMWAVEELSREGPVDQILSMLQLG